MYQVMRSWLEVSSAPSQSKFNGELHPEVSKVGIRSIFNMNVLVVSNICSTICYIIYIHSKVYYVYDMYIILLYVYIYIMFIVILYIIMYTYVMYMSMCMCMCMHMHMFTFIFALHHFLIVLHCIKSYYTIL